MKFVVATLGIISLVGCSSSPEYKEQSLVIDKYVPAMSRNEIITAINECETNNTRAVMVYGKRKVNGHITDVVIDVSCAPKQRYN
jgi:uncharacterized protein YcfL